MVIKAIIFDLDNTLYDTEKLSEIAGKQAVEEMIKAGLNCTLGEGLRKFKEIIKEKDKFERLLSFFGPNKQDIVDIGLKRYYRDAEFDSLDIFPGVIEVLNKLKNNYKLFLLTQGEQSQQVRKINALGIESFFDEIFFAPVEKKEETFEQIRELEFKPEEMLIVGDRIDKEIKLGNLSGMKTVKFNFGKYSLLKPQSDLEKPDFVINNLNEIFEVINKINNSNGNGCKEKINLKIVTIGGGTGTSSLLEGLKEYTDNITSIVTVTDNGRSTGMIRRELDMPAPGDVRNCLLALANSEKLMCDLFQYRFEDGNLEGYSFGNLFIAALTKLTGSFEKAVEEAGRILNLKGKVLPATFDNINICAELEDGKILESEDSIIDRHNDYVYLRPRIKRVFHKPEARVNEKALKAIKEADLIILSPGSLFTSVISNLLIKGISEAIDNSKAKKIYVCNIMTQVSQTHGLKASDHVKEILKYLNSKLDFVILNNNEPSKDLLESYKKENAFLVENDCDELEKLGVRIFLGSFLDDVEEKKLLWEKKDLLRHNPEKIAELIVCLAKENVEKR
ncbi:MAG: uridine diphosphate-N-acetylglucosamine-binding protein YvcK [archaeon]